MVYTKKCYTYNMRSKIFIYIFLFGTLRNYKWIVQRIAFQQTISSVILFGNKSAISRALYMRACGLSLIQTTTKQVQHIHVTI